MKATSYLLKATGSSARWLTRQQNDPFVKARSSASLTGDGSVPRSRAGFKLDSLAKRHPRILPRGGVVVDLGAAPGGWSQVASHAVGPRGKVIALDLLPISPLKNVSFIQGDFLSSSVQLQLHTFLLPPPSVESLPLTPPSLEAGQTTTPPTRQVDSVISDMMANMSGIKSRDIENSLMLCEAALGFAMGVLKTRSRKERDGPVRGGMLEKGGCLVLKHFQHPLLNDFEKEQLVPRFDKVYFEKPKESRKESSEAYFVCLGYTGVD